MRHPNIIGIDVSDSSIKVLQLEDLDTIAAYGTAPLPQGVVENGHILDKQIFSDTLQKILAETKPKALRTSGVPLRAVLCLPETKLFTHYVVLPETLRKAEIASFVEDAAKKIVPYEIEDLYWDFHTVEKSKTRTATFVGVPKDDLDNYVEAFSLANVKPSFVGGELSSLGRALLPQGSLEEGYLMVDIGAHSTAIGIFGDDSIANISIIVPKGGDFFTKVISDELEVPLEEAEILKRQYGVAISEKDKNVRELLYPHVMIIVDKIREATAYFEKKTAKKVTHIIVAGGSALLPGLCSLIQDKTGVITELADPVRKIKNAEVLGKDTPGIIFSTVIGLAHHANTQLPSINLLTLYRYQEHDAQKELLNIRDIHTLSDLRYFTYGVYRTLKEFIDGRIGYFAAFKKFDIRLFGSLIFLGLTLTFLVWVIFEYM